MPALRAILNAIRRAVKRDLGTFRSLKLNNFFLFIALMIGSAAQSGVEPKAAEPLILFLVFLLMFPLSADPLHKIPPARLAIWPLTRRQRFGLRLASIGFSPVLWLVVLILLLKTVRPALALAFLFTVIAVQGIATLGRQAIGHTPHWKLLRYVPQFPGRLGGLVRHNVREMLSVLDIYLALLLAAGGAAYRLCYPHPDPDAFPILSLLIALAMSTYAQCLFGLDSNSSAMTRYRLLPLAGWQILLAKDVAFLGFLLLLVLPLDPAPGLTFGFTALAIGHHPSVLLPIPQRRWRFTGSRLLPGAIQGIGSVALGFAEHQRGMVFLVFSVAACLISLRFYGWLWDRRC